MAYYHHINGVVNEGLGEIYVDGVETLNHNSPPNLQFKRNHVTRSSMILKLLNF